MPILNPETSECILSSGVVLQNIHDPAACEGQGCCIHHPSQHPLRDAPMQWLSTLKLMMRRCEHDALHPDRDDLRHIGATNPLLAFRLWLYHHCCPQHCCTDTGGGGEPLAICM